MGEALGVCRCAIPTRSRTAILDSRGPIMGSLKSPCASIEAIALNCLVFEKIAFLHFGDRQTDRQMDRLITLKSNKLCKKFKCNKSMLRYFNKPITS